ncbi:MAG TPA: hypothetical protein VKN37_07385 [Roseovarius sp.]|nr:hypothetical protein [Roseovarius sp.]
MIDHLFDIVPYTLSLGLSYHVVTATGLHGSHGLLNQLINEARVLVPSFPCTFLQKSIGRSR